MTFVRQTSANEREFWKLALMSHNRVAEFASESILTGGSFIFPLPVYICCLISGFGGLMLQIFCFMRYSTNILRNKCTLYHFSSFLSHSFKGESFDKAFSCCTLQHLQVCCQQSRWFGYSFSHPWSWTTLVSGVSKSSATEPLFIGKDWNYPSIWPPKAALINSFCSKISNWFPASWDYPRPQCLHNAWGLWESMQTHSRPTSLKWRVDKSCSMTHWLWPWNTEKTQR